MKEWIPSLNERLRKQDEPIEIVDFFRHTGNFLLQVGQIGEDKLRVALEKSLETPTVLVSLQNLDSYLYTLKGTQAPPPRSGYRWTPGLVLQVRGHGCAKATFTTDRAHFNRIDSTTVAAWKLDCLDEHGRLDRDKRSGGWGAIAKDVSDKVGGIWTARSLSTVIGTVELTTNVGAG